LDIVSEEDLDAQLHEEASNLPDPGIGRVWLYAQDDWRHFALAVTCASINGCMFPLLGYFFGDIVQSLYQDDSMLRRQSLQYMGVFLGFGTISIFTQWA